MLTRLFLCTQYLQRPQNGMAIFSSRLEDAFFFRSSLFVALLLFTIHDAHQQFVFLSLQTTFGNTKSRIDISMPLLKARPMFLLGTTGSQPYIYVLMCDNALTRLSEDATLDYLF